MNKKISTEEWANEILALDARVSGHSLRSSGILNERRLRRVAQKEIPMSDFLSHKPTEDNGA